LNSIPFTPRHFWGIIWIFLLPIYFIQTFIYENVQGIVLDPSVDEIIRYGEESELIIPGKPIILWFVSIPVYLML